MWPRFRSGDYVVVLAGPLARPVREGDVVVFRDDEGRLKLKRLAGLLEGDVAVVDSLNPEAPVIPPFPKDRLAGRVVWHIKAGRPLR